jgi:hypothetical protein
MSNHEMSLVFVTKNVRLVAAVEKLVPRIGVPRAEAGTCPSRDLR